MTLLLDKDYNVEYFLEREEDKIIIKYSNSNWSENIQGRIADTLENDGNGYLWNKKRINYDDMERLVILIEAMGIKNEFLSVELNPERSVASKAK